MRTHAPPLVRTLMTVAADLRAAGNTWETIALRLKRTVATVRGWPTRYADDWGRLYRAAEHRQLADAALEASLLLRKLLRSQDERVVERVCKFLYDRHCKVLLEQDKQDAGAVDSAGDRDDDWEAFIAYVESLTDEQRQALEADLVANRVAQARDGVPPDRYLAGPAVAE